MSRYLLDTSVYCQPLKRKGDAASIRRWSRTGDDRCAIAVVTRAEVEWGLHRLAVPRLWALYDQVLKSRLVVLPTDAAVWAAFSRMKAAQAAMGRPVADLDLLIAATAVEHGLTLATLNTRHFALIQGLVFEDWSRE